MRTRCCSLKLKLSGHGPVAAIGVLGLSLALAVPGLGATPPPAELVLGQSAALSGPSAMLGQ